MTLKFDCVTCGQEFKLDKEEGGVVMVVWLDGAKFYACSLECAAEARDDESKGNSVKKRPFAGFGSRPGKRKGRNELIPGRNIPPWKEVRKEEEG